MKIYTDREIAESGWSGREYYSRADLIAAGVLVPVPDGEAVDSGEIIVGSIGLEQRNYKWRDGIGYNDGLGVKSIIDHDWMDISEDEDATPVRLVRLEEVG